MTKEEIEKRPRKVHARLPDELRAVHGSIRLTPARWIKLRRLGMDWLSQMLDRVNEPAPKK